MGDFFYLFYDLKTQNMPNLENAIFDETPPLKGGLNPFFWMFLYLSCISIYNTYIF